MGVQIQDLTPASRAALSKRLDKAVGQFYADGDVIDEVNAPSD